MNSNGTRSKHALAVTRTGLIINTVLTLLKYVAGFAGKSSAMVADATHSLSDVATDVIMLLGFRVIDKPADSCHQYGHGKIETLLGAVCGAFLLLAGAGIFYSGALKIVNFIRGDAIPRPGLIAFLAALVSVLAKEALFRYTIIVAVKLKSPALKANAWHHRSDALSSLAVLVGTGAAVFLGNRWVILDPLAALIVTFYIVRVAVGIMKETFYELVEGSVDRETNIDIKRIMNSTKGVRNVHNVRTRRIGHYFAVEAHIVVDRHLSLMEAHDISSVIERRIYEKYGDDTLVTIHVEPSSLHKNYPERD